MRAVLGPSRSLKRDHSQEEIQKEKTSILNLKERMRQTSLIRPDQMMKKHKRQILRETY